MRTSSLSSFRSSSLRIAAVAAAIVLAASSALAAGAPQGSVVSTGAVTVAHDGACLFAYGLDDLAPIAQYECLGTTDQSFQLEGTGDGISFVLASSNSGMCLSVAGSSLSDGALVVQDTCSAALNERFMPVRYNDGSYLLVALSSGKCIEVPNSSTSVVQLDQTACTGGANQRFTLPLPAGDILLGGSLVVQATGAVVNPPAATGSNPPGGWNLKTNTN